ncbi:6-phosphogluconolactonase [Chitinimonas taiwanensis]|jgi:6-phosphogluconolactonase|uniref:6-phosphogluconolactonase n=1 Tax=Chitinimonas taiwanensis TaxID=240412 RepID=UPI0035B1CF7A
MADLRIHDYDSRVDLDICLAREVAAALETALRERGVASLAVSGGRTPVGMFQQLRQMRLDWSRVWITLVDDRWLPADHEDSNERLVREHLLKYQVEAANFVGLKTAAATPEAGLDAVEAALAPIPQPFDVLILGMGEDGHTASLFPCSAELASAAALDNPRQVAAVNPTSAPYARISLTLAAIVRSRNLFLHLTGAKKKAIFDAAMAAPTDRLPIARVFDAASGVCHMYWAE